MRSLFAFVLAALYIGMMPAHTEPLNLLSFMDMSPTYHQLRPQSFQPVARDEDMQQDQTLRRTVVSYQTSEPPGSVIISTREYHLYYVLGGGQAIRYGIGVGRPGFTWAGVHLVSAKKEWPDWTPPDEMIARQPYLPRFVAGGSGNPLGARALYLGPTMYRIHGTNDPSTIGHNVSSGCIRLTNKDVADLYDKVKMGARVVVMK